MPPISPRKSCALCLVDDSSVSFFQMIDSRQKTTFTHLFLGFSLGGWFNPSLICCWALLGWKKVFEFFLTFLGSKVGFFRATLWWDHTFCEWIVTHQNCCCFLLVELVEDERRFCSTQLSGHWVCEGIGVEAIWRSGCEFSWRELKEEELVSGSNCPNNCCCFFQGLHLVSCPKM